MNTTFKNQLTFILLTLLFVTLICSVLFLSSKSDEKLNDIARYETTYDALDEILKQSYMIEFSQRGFKNFKDSAYLSFLDTSEFKLKGYVDTVLYSNTINVITSDEKKRIKLLTDNRLKLVEHLNDDSTIQDYKATLYKVSKNMKFLSVEISMIKRKLKDKITNTQESFRDLQNNVILIIIITGFVALIAFGFYFFITNKNSRENEKLRLELVKKNEIANEQNEELAVLNQELEQFAFVASHDLQEPLRKIKMFGNLLVEEYHENNPYVSRIINASDRMQNLIKDLLNFSRVSRNVGKEEKVDLDRLIERVLDDLSFQIEETNAVVNLNIRHKLINANETQVQQLFQNLISNGIKFSREGVSPVVNVLVEVRDEKIEGIDTNAHLYIEVQDNGIGFEQKYAEQIFTIFNRLHGKSEYEGTGIGLAICAKVCENHDGFIKAESEVGKGTKFKMYFPINNK